MAISQDLTKPRRQENTIGTPQYNLMQEQMKVVYNNAMKKDELGEYIDLSDLKYTMTSETRRQWVDGKTKFEDELNTKLE